MISSHFFNVMIWNYPIETTIKKWLFGVPATYIDLIRGFRGLVIFFYTDDLLTLPKT